MLLTKARGQTALRWTLLRILLEFLQYFRIVFNISNPWSIRTDLPCVASFCELWPVYPQATK